MIGYWIVSYESSDSELEGAEEVEPIEPLVESEPLGLLWWVSEIEDQITIQRTLRSHINHKASQKCPNPES